MKLFIRTIMALVALAAAALSFQSLMHLGQLCGYGELSWAYPLVLDLGAAACCAEWLHARNRQALAMTWGLILLSVVLNGTVHYLTTEGTPPGWMLVVLVAAVPPAVFGLVVHLGWSNSTPVRAVVPDSGADLPVPVAETLPGTLPEPSGETPETPSESEGVPAGVRAESAPRHAVTPTVTNTVTSDKELVEKVQAILAENPDAGRATIAGELGITPHHARKVLALTNGHVK